MTRRPVVISAPEPRTLEMIFAPEPLRRFRTAYEVIDCAPEAIGDLPAPLLASARYIVGQPPLSGDLLERMQGLRCIFNVEGNFLNNMPYDGLFRRGVHVVTTSAVFAEPVAEMGLAMALNLARGVIGADNDFRAGREVWGLDGNGSARLLSGAEIGFIGFGDLGRALNRLLTGFRPRVRIYDPWLPAPVLRAQGGEPASLDDVLAQSDVVFVVASVTSENQGFLDAAAFARMRRGAAFILLSRAGVVNFDDLVAAVAAGHIVAASDVFPEEPLAADHPVRGIEGFLRSAHRAGALDVAFKRMGDMVLEDMSLIDRGLPPVLCRRAERETVEMMRSKPVAKS